MVQDRGLGGSRCGAIVVTCDCVQELGEDGRIEVAGALLDRAQAEMDVAQQAALLGLAEGRPAAELADAADVVQQRGGEEEVGAEAWVELGGLAAECGDANRVLEQPTRVSVVAVGGCGGQRAQRGSHVRVRDEGLHERGEAGMGDLGGEELEESVELVGVAPERRREGRRVGVRDGLDRAHLYLQLSVEALDATQDPDGVALAEPLVEQLDVAPHARLDAPARVGELQREIGSARTRAAPLLPGHREHAFDGPVLGELGDRRHGPGVYGWGKTGTDFSHLGARHWVFACAGRRVQALRSRAMAVVEPFRAVRYTGAAGPLADLVAPPYDIITPAERDRLFARSPYNVARLTLPESAGEAGRLYREWLEEGILAQEEEPAAWLLAETIVGPDGVERERRGVVVSLAAEPYEAGRVLPHERTYGPVRDDRLELLRATGAQPEPIFLLREGRPEIGMPTREPDLVADGSRLWRLAGDDAGLADATLLVADGHHRYESAIELGRELGGGARIMALVVSTGDPGLHVFATHRLFSGRPDLAEPGAGERFANVEDAFAALRGRSFDRSAAVAYRAGGAELVEGKPGELDVMLVDRFGLEGISYASDVEEALAAVDRGEADVAFLVRAPRVEDVFAVARRGDRMPPKSTYFFPKPLSGLLFHPVRP